VFSKSGALTDPNMDTETLCVLTQGAKNMASYKPPHGPTKDKYFELFSGVHQDDTEAVDEGTDQAPAEGTAQAAANEDAG
jgi:hypothetical protein